MDDRNGGPGLPLGAAHDAGLRRGSIYTVSYVRQEFIDVAEVRSLTGETACWYAKRFRPLIEKKTDISIFTEMRTPKIKHREVERT